MNIGNAPGLSGPPEEDGRVSQRAAELFEEWSDNTTKLAEAAEHVLGFTSWAEHSAQAVAGVMLGHADDQDSRDLAFMRDLRTRVGERLSDMAYEQAEKESSDWPSWREVQKRRAA